MGKVTLKALEERLDRLEAENARLKKELKKEHTNKVSKEERERKKKEFVESAKAQTVEAAVTVKDHGDSLEYTLQFTVKKQFSITSKKRTKLIAGIKPAHGENPLVGIGSFGLYLND